MALALTVAVGQLRRSSSSASGVSTVQQRCGLGCRSFSSLVQMASRHRCKGRRSNGCNVIRRDARCRQQRALHLRYATGA